MRPVVRQVLLLRCKSIAFIDYVRTHHIIGGRVKLRPITGGGHNTGKSTTAVGVRFGYEMHDQFIYHFCAMFSRTITVKLLIPLSVH